MFGERTTMGTELTIRRGEGDLRFNEEEGGWLVLGGVAV